MDKTKQYAVNLSEDELFALNVLMNLPMGDVNFNAPDPAAVQRRYEHGRLALRWRVKDLVADLERLEKARQASAPPALTAPDVDAALTQSRKG